MHGMICKSLEGFIVDRHGRDMWMRICERADLPFEQFETLRVYDDALMLRAMEATQHETKRGTAALFEDIGHWLCTHPPMEPVRRLIRFGGSTFEQLLISLEEVHDRARMALPGIELPVFRLEEVRDGEYEIVSRWNFAGAGALLMGIMRAMADDYGALALIEYGDSREDGEIWEETILVQVVERDFHAPREFSLTGAA